jgi:DNA modification methylase
MPTARISPDAPVGVASSLRLEQSRLNIDDKSRTSRLPWRGQFSPELVEYLIEMTCFESTTILDPFCGSGTVLFEAIDMGKSAYGLEVNPAAWHLASLSSFSSLPNEEQRLICTRLKQITSYYSVGTTGLFHGGAKPTELLETIADEPHSFMRNALASVIILGMGDKLELSSEAIARGASAVIGLLNNMGNSTGRAQCFLADARQIPLNDASVDAVITSPPYINVFNYHQNYRPAVEFLGWRPLEASRSEIGANRKHRMNRFKTVIQYCLDMAQSLNEIVRVLNNGAPLVIVLGRTSNVLGASFKNGAIIEALLAAGGAFAPAHRSERVFTNRFGVAIFEDIVISRRIGSSKISPSAAHEIGRQALILAQEDVPAKNRSSLEEAIANSSKVDPSPLLALSMPKTNRSTAANKVIFHGRC